VDSMLTQRLNVKLSTSAPGMRVRFSTGFKLGFYLHMEQFNNEEEQCFSLINLDLISIYFS
jgi:hypothetical protein